jgi:hypothetical protein
MRKHFTLFLSALLLMSVTAFAGGRDKKRNPETTAKIVKFDETTAAATASTIEKNGFVQATENLNFNGTPTGLTWLLRLPMQRRCREIHRGEPF